MIDNQPEDIIVLYFKVSEFLNREDALFKTHKNDAKNYATAYEIAFEQIFEDKEPPPKGRAE